MTFETSILFPESGVLSLQLRNAFTKRGNFIKQLPDKMTKLGVRKIFRTRK